MHGVQRVKCQDWTLRWPVFMVLFLTVFFRGARRDLFFLRQERLLIHTPAAYWINQHLLFHPGLPLLSPAPVALGFSQGLLSLYA